MHDLDHYSTAFLSEQLVCFFLGLRVLIIITYQKNGNK